MRLWTALASSWTRTSPSRRRVPPAQRATRRCSFGRVLARRGASFCPGVALTRRLCLRLQSPQLLGFSLSWELDYANVLTLLERAGVALLAAERGEGQPLVFGGGSVLTGNPEPYAAFFDCVLLGDGEDLLAAFVAAAAAARDAGASRAETLRLLCRVPGVYVPSLYDVTYDGPAGPISAISPKHDDVPPTVAKQTYRGATLAASTVVSPRMAWENIYMVEVVRSCPEVRRPRLPSICLPGFHFG